MKYLEEILDAKIDDPKLFNQAFIHTSYVNEHNMPKIESNERLEFLGDAVLEIVVSEFLYRTYPQEQEGVLTRMRSQLVREESLAQLALNYKFDQYLKLGHGERTSGGSQRPSILADCFEAFLGAVYLTFGISKVEYFLNQDLLKNHRHYIESDIDYKTVLQELLQKKGSVNIEYRLEDAVGPAHAQIFTMGLYVNDKFISQGQGTSKKSAEVQAAKIAYQMVDEKGNIHVSRKN